jgi:hypothetical protein
MLGVRREGVTEAAGKLRDAGIIEYSRGHIKVLDRPKLEQHVCECYAVVKKEIDPQTGAACLRMLRRGKEGNRSAAIGHTAG